MTEIGIFEKTFRRPSYPETLDAVAAHGLTAIQLHLEAAGLDPMPREIPAGTRRMIREETSRRGITVAAVSATYNMIHPNPAVRADGLARLAVIAEAAADLGTSVVTLCTGTRDPADKWRHHPDNATATAWADLVTAIAAALEIAERHGITLAIEPEPANVVRDALAARRLLDEMGSPRLRIILDPANIVAGALNHPPSKTLDDAFALLGDDIVIAHAKDVDPAGRFCPARDGIVPWSHYVTLLRRVGYTAPLILHTLAEGDVSRCVATLQTALADR